MASMGRHRLGASGVAGGKSSWSGVARRWDGAMPMASRLLLSRVDCFCTSLVSTIIGIFVSFLADMHSSRVHVPSCWRNFIHLDDEEVSMIEIIAVPPRTYEHKE
ncbi:hypothetical protein GUJ93_ZPchr0005g14480 [Zizania palustris]|uniref:Uncharacterized protein n=1 Tax=Zizania palustris TaxID=103762 RepID=A0A8J5SN40_ZIZPA|nr:hypothetical protein GUJ93_ZPchr0005g14480 [Zizania palustris]